MPRCKEKKPFRSTVSNRLRRAFDLKIQRLSDKSHPTETVYGFRNFRKETTNVRLSVQSIREDSSNILAEELLRERAAVLGRAGRAVEDALEKLAAIDRRLIALLNSGDEASRDDASADPMLVNDLIDQFNDACRLAELKYYYLIVTREAMGLRKHDLVRDIYRIPPKKKRIRAI